MKDYKGFCIWCTSDLDACSKCDYFENNEPINFKRNEMFGSVSIKEKIIFKCPHCKEESNWDLVRTGYDMNGEEDIHFMVEMYQCMNCLGYFNVYLDIKKIIALKEMQ